MADREKPSRDQFTHLMEGMLNRARREGYEAGVAELRATAERLEGENKTARENEAALEHACQTYAGIVEELKATAERYQQALESAKECADDLEAELRGRYGWPDIHPAMQIRFDRDMEPVVQFRAALASSLPAPLPAPEAT